MHRVRSTEFGRERLSKAPLVDELRRAHAEVREVVQKLTGADLTTEIEVELRGSRRRATRAADPRRVLIVPLHSKRRRTSLIPQVPTAD